MSIASKLRSLIILEILKYNRNFKTIQIEAKRFSAKKVALITISIARKFKQIKKYIIEVVKIRALSNLYNRSQFSVDNKIIFRHFFDQARFHFKTLQYNLIIAYSQSV